MCFEASSVVPYLKLKVGWKLLLFETVNTNLLPSNLQVYVYLFGVTKEALFNNLANTLG